MEITIDITPLAINRTAMYFIVRDTVRHLIDSAYTVSLIGMGVPIGLKEFILHDYKLTKDQESLIGERLMHAVEKGVGQKPPLEEEKFSLEGGLFFAFDPLYLLFYSGQTATVSFVLDLTPITRPSWHSAKVATLYHLAFSLLLYKRVHIISISLSTTRDLWVNYGIPSNRVLTVPLYNRLPPQRTSNSKDSKRLLFVGSMEMRKNIESLIVAFVNSELHLEGYELRIAGGDGHGGDAIKNLARANAGAGVHLLGRVSEDELEAEYNQCLLLVFPSLWEGFGLPALEAFYRGIPLVLADSGALPEIGGPWATYVDPCDVLSIQDGLRAACARLRSSDGMTSGTSDFSKADWLSRFSFQNYTTHIRSCLDRLGISPVP
jgi:glycosyltransferase involved in cell wall biosynthesis